MIALNPGDVGVRAMVLWFCWVSVLAATAQGSRSALLAAQATQAVKRAPTVRGFETPKWPERGTMLVRAESEASGILLLTLDSISYDDAGQRTHDRNAVYRYDPRAGTLTEVGADSWCRSTPIRSCVGLANRSVGQLRIALQKDPKTGNAYPFRGVKLHFEDRRVRTRGQIDLTIIPLPESDFAVILSAMQYRAPAMGLFMGHEEGIAGPYYHQVFSRTDGKPRGPVIRPELPVRSGRVRGCITTDGRYAVYASEKLDHISIVHLKSARKASDEPDKSAP